MLGKVILAAFMLVFLVAAEEQQKSPHGRQLNWNGLNYLSKPGYGSNGADLDGSASMLASQATQAKSSSNFQSLSPQSLDGSDINRDGSYSASSSGGGDYGYEASPDSSYSAGSSYGSGYGDESRLGGFVTAVSAFLPIGLFLAAIVPNIITVSSGRRKRSTDEKEQARAVRDEATFPILDMISSFGVRALQEPECQTKIVCEIGRMGGLPEANAVQRALWLTANYVPERMSRLVGLDKLFRQIRSQQCSNLKCASG